MRKGFLEMLLNRRLGQKSEIVYRPASYQVSDPQIRPVRKCQPAGSKCAMRQVLELQAGLYCGCGPLVKSPRLMLMR